MSLIARLIEAGTPADLVAEVAMALARAEVAQEAIETRRSKDRERQQRKRGNVTSRDITGQSVTDPSPPCPPLDKETPPTPPKEINPPPIPPQPDTADAVVDCGQSPPVSPSELIEAWNLTAEKHGLPKVSKISDQRKAKIRTFLRNNTIEEIQQGLAAIERSRWLRGENDRGWKADFDFFLQPKSFTKLIEGSYDH